MVIAATLTGHPARISIAQRCADTRYRREMAASRAERIGGEMSQKTRFMGSRHNSIALEPPAGAAFEDATFNLTLRTCFHSERLPGLNARTGNRQFPQAAGVVYATRHDF